MDEPTWKLMSIIGTLNKLEPVEYSELTNAYLLVFLTTLSMVNVGPIRGEVNKLAEKELEKMKRWKSDMEFFDELEDILGEDNE